MVNPRRLPDLTAARQSRRGIDALLDEDQQPLNHLVASAVALGGGNLCAAGHQWEMIGGRQCPRGCNNSQPVYVCARCGGTDYGEPGGPAHAECYARGETCCDGMKEPETTNL